MKNKLVFGLAFLLLYSNSITSQTGIPTDSLHTFIKNNSIYKNQVNWESIDSLLQLQLKQSQTDQDSVKAFSNVFKALGDVHSRIYFKGKTYNHFEGLSSYEYNAIKDLKTIADDRKNKIFRFKFLQGIVYIRIPSMDPSDSASIHKLAQSLHDSIVLFTPGRVKGYIIDLRLNTGGNVYPMLAGISSLLGDGIIAKESDSDGRISRSWSISGANVFADSIQLTYIESRKLEPISSKPVAVLIGPLTASSGAMTAIAFKRRPQTIFIGEPTAKGYTSSTTFYTFSNDLKMDFASNTLMDRAQSVYNDSVSPDQLVFRGDNFANLLADKKVRAAINWIQKIH
ncbi:MAG: hypothetical protein IPM92_07715 [Saprospiraceae bacterium]|nr:hypothetical protein [Saprospiraceae bacterium]